MSKPLALSDSQMDAVFTAAAALQPCDHDAFLRTLADALGAEPELGDGTVAKAIRSLQRQYFRPPEIPREMVQHRRVGSPLE